MKYKIGDKVKIICKCQQCINEVVYGSIGKITYFYDRRIEIKCFDRERFFDQADFVILDDEKICKRK